MSPAAQKFQVLILCSLLDSSVTLSSSSLPGLMPCKRHIAEANQNAAEPHPVISAAVSMNDFIIVRIAINTAHSTISCCVRRRSCYLSAFGKRTSRERRERVHLARMTHSAMGRADIPQYSSLS
jgi:hypothetical protein